MRNLLNFIVRYSRWFVFAFYFVISLILLVSRDDYRRSVYLTSANEVTGSVFHAWSQMTEYFNLRSVNESLQARNAALQSEVFNLRNRLSEYEALLGDSLPHLEEERFGHVSAAVINNNTRHPRNYFTINRGRLDGVETGMGVIDQNGVVGIVNVAGDHMARVISLLNENQHFSVKLKNTPFIGSLSWKGSDPTIAYVEEMPRHIVYHVGDTIVTSGYSTAFPEGIPVGVILNRVRGADDSFFSFKVRLSPDFKALTTVVVIKDIYKTEIDSLSSFDLLK